MTEGGNTVEAAGQGGLRLRSLISGAFIAAWLATLIPVLGAAVEAIQGPPSLTNANLLLGLLFLLPELPGLIFLEIVCLVWRNTCSLPGGALSSESASSFVLLVGNALGYMAVTYPVAKALQRRAAARDGSQFWAISRIVGRFALGTSAFLAGWMVFAQKAYYVHPMKPLSVSSLAFAAGAFYSCFMVRPLDG